MSRASYDRLVAAGAPELPEGFLYRVSFHNRMFVAVKVEIRERIKVLSCIPWTRVVGSYELYLKKDEDRTALEVVEYCCRGAVGEANQRMADGEFDREMRQLEGDHP